MTIERLRPAQAEAAAVDTTVSMSNPTNHIEIITSVQRRRRWAAAEKVRMVEETFEPGMTVSLVARRHGVAPNQLFTWRRLVAQGGLTAAGSGEEVVPASDYRALSMHPRFSQRKFSSLQRPFGFLTIDKKGTDASGLHG
jgi:transposase